EHLVKFMKINDHVQIEIGGHTDNVGSDSHNQTLSNNRAGEVKKYLYSRGIAKGRVLSKGYGEKSPIQSNDNEEGRAMNRRTVCRIVGL
ncbi:MAG: OmpA family protein, partial [Bacteroidota bacterium]